MSTPLIERTIALVVTYREQDPILLDSLSDDNEISTLEKSILVGGGHPLEMIYEEREKKRQCDQVMGAALERVIQEKDRPQEVKFYAIDWFKTKSRIDQLLEEEAKSREVIAKFAFQLFCEDHRKKDFFLQGSQVKLRVRVFILWNNCERNSGLWGAA